MDRTHADNHGEARPTPATRTPRGDPEIPARHQIRRPSATRTAVALALAAALGLGALPAHAVSDAPSAGSGDGPAAAASPTPSASPTPTTASPSPVPSVEPSAEPSVEPSPTPSPSTPEPTVTSPQPPPELASPEPLGDSGPGEAPRLLAPATMSTMVATQAAPRITFTDVSARQGSASFSKFAAEIAWLANSGVTRGWLMSDGTREYRPLDHVNRDAMAAFLYRYAGEPAHYAPTRSPFRDLTTTSNPFYTQISWAADAGISRGWSVSGGAEFRPYESITREAMAAFLYRFAGSPDVTLPSRSPFLDVRTSDPFYKHIVWLASTGATTGWVTDRGAEFRPRSSITRDAMAAFLYRLDRAGVGYAPAAGSGPLIRHPQLSVYGAGTLNIRSGPSTGHEVIAQRRRGDTVIPTGTVSSSGWVEIAIDGRRGWVSGYYLIGRDGAAITRVTSTYDNGRVPESTMCRLSWDRAELLLCQAASDLERLNASFKERFGRNIPINDSYRTYEDQVRAKLLYGNLAATPGTSNHGWGAAIDIAGASLPGGYSGAPYLWLRQQLTGYNWNLPSWARPEGSKPEPWHFEYTG